MEFLLKNKEIILIILSILGFLVACGSLFASYYAIKKTKEIKVEQKLETMRLVWLRLKIQEKKKMTADQIFEDWNNPPANFGSASDLDPRKPMPKKYQINDMIEKLNAMGIVSYDMETQTYISQR